MRWPWRRRHEDRVVLAEDDAVTRALQDMAAQWQAEEQAAARRALTEPTQQVPMDLPLMTLAAQWRADGGGAR